jgi:carboxypeptidase Q
MIRGVQGATVRRNWLTKLGLGTAAAVAIVGALCQAWLSAQQQPASPPALAAIRAEGMSRSEAPRLFSMLTDVLGPRLSGSPAHLAAARWAVDQLKEWGLADARLEPFEFGRGWTLEKLTAEMTSPRYAPLLAYAEAWSPATAGMVSGTPIYVGELSADEIDRLGARLRGAIVLAYRPQTEFLRADRMEPSVGSPVRTGNPPYPDASSATPAAALLARLRAHGAAVVLRPGAMEHGTVRVQGNRATAPDAVPTAVLAAEQYNMLVRLAQMNRPLQVRVDIGARFENGPDSYNVIAEIPGSDPVLRDEVVLVGAHLDSWHTATGATDNADGVVAVMEAMRILSRLEARPRRTVRVALWSGEEQGLLGSAAHVARHLRDAAARGRISVYLNDDPGTGPTYGFYMQGNEPAKRIFDGWLEPLRDLGVRRNVIEGINATDHLAFDEAGIPAFTVIKDFRNYDTRTRHTNADYADAVSAGDLTQSATVLATVAWQAAMRDDKIPRKAAK